jgi:hypothetical protein
MAGAAIIWRDTDFVEHGVEIDFELPVVVRARPARGSVARWVAATHTVRHDIPEFSSEEAPVVLRYRHTTRLEDFERGAREGLFGVREEAFRGIDDRLYSDAGYAFRDGRVESVVRRRAEGDDGPLFAVAGRAVRDLVAKQRLEPKFAAAPDKFVHPRLFAAVAVNQPAVRDPLPCLEPLGDVPLRDDIGESLARQVEAFRDRLASFVLVDGRLHAAEPEPLIRLSMPRAVEIWADVVRRDHRFSLLGGDRPGLSLKALGYFRVSDMSSMIDEGGAVAGREGYRFVDGGMEVWLADGFPIVADAEGLSFVTLAAALKEFLVSGFVEAGDTDDEARARVCSRLSAMPPDLLRAWQDIDRGIASFCEHRVPACLERAVIEVMSDDAARRSFVSPGLMARFADDILRRWLARPVSLDAVHEIEVGHSP